VSYSQIALFNRGFERPFNDWSEAHVKQGFSWRDGSVSFKTLIESGPVAVIFSIETEFSPGPDSVRAISVPFHCNDKYGVEIATITEARAEAISPGFYQLVFETGFDGANSWCRLTAILEGDAEPRVLVADRDLDPRYPLLMDAGPA
jgi:hypothetical protein